ncbi:AbrB/MazE/SpoVT family DNA-binding domain-containing protein [Imperialibacter roseus]|jgi:antitoxin VapB|uniref:AbrB/MazE/SpoVT family DNA-binding domain-containing protein n=1 Tax=Imperialibacter roseus TaxID=1324217 RepID=A0ABZ0IGZ1_9BACT|nr:AbrB/MazE/SpoVT family DNA-binding domain-containing protein [Imperialibacter roseus]WOK04277.1 AbrB/MazE/SpoVT family DNA-binding domain-containing protein [Imperialibacter roseus]|tara:strand:+ start:2639 stop:2875 length:237 start_codon:yes stop_codon:yes gene_type:complete
MGFETIDIKDSTGTQLIGIPESLKINDNKAYLKKVGNVLYIIPFHDPWKSLIDSVNEFSDDFMIERDQPIEQKRETFD